MQNIPELIKSSGVVRPKLYEFPTADGVVLRMTRYVGGEKGPVLLAHGLGAWSGMFAAPTIRRNFAQYLVENGYDVWLLDWRGSIQLPLRQFTLDQVAQNDYPAAVELMLRETRADSVQAVAHCTGALTFCMSLALGKLPAVRALGCSQVALHIDVPAAAEVKALMRLPDLLAASGRQYLTPTEDPTQPLFQALFGQLVNTIHHECRSTTCHRLTSLYGHVYSHASMNGETHDRLEEQFGKCNLLAFRHLAQLTRSGVARRFDFSASENRQRYASSTPPSYLNPEHFRIPIRLVSGGNNRVFEPRSTELTYNWLVQHNDADLYSRRVIQDYGHADTFMGARADLDAYPAFLELLESSPR